MVRIGYTTDALYVSFKAQDSDPSAIRAHLRDRDSAFSDDWVGLSLDARGTGQVSYHMMVNPNGIQLDMLNSVSGDEDMSPDWVWESAGRRNERGYAVEIRLPLESIQFSGGDKVRMGILFWRRISRVGVSVAWPALELRAIGTLLPEREGNVDAFDPASPGADRPVEPALCCGRRSCGAGLAWSPVWRLGRPRPPAPRREQSPSGSCARRGAKAAR